MGIVIMGRKEEKARFLARVAKGEDIKPDVYRRVDDVDIVDKDRSSQEISLIKKLKSVRERD